MREIKFRGKSTFSGEWVYGNGAGLIDGYTQLFTPLGMLQIEESSEGQFTGLTDRNGVEIFEGDILAISGRRDVMLQVVTFEEGFYCTDEFALFELTRDKNWSIEVVGNIHEHPHLIEGVK